MDILTRLLNTIESEMGADIWSPERRADFERQFRFAEGGEAHHIATSAAMDRAARNEKIRAQVAQGIPMALVAERHGISRKTVWVVVSA